MEKQVEPTEFLRQYFVILQQSACKVWHYKVEADKAAEILILADERGIDSHGCARLMAYFSMLKNKIINPRPKIKIITETESTATVDGDNGLGLIVGPKCNEIAMEKQKVGSGWVSVRNTHPMVLQAVIHLKV